jgi:hypothetical protein
MSEHRWTAEEVAAAWESGQIRPHHAGLESAVPRGARSVGFVDFSIQGRNERLREARRQRAALQALEGS